MFPNHIYLLYMNETDLALNNQKVEYPFITIAFKSTWALSGST